MCPFLCGNHGIRDAASVPYANCFPKPPLNVVGMDVCGPRPRPPPYRPSNPGIE